MTDKPEEEVDLTSMTAAELDEFVIWCYAVDPDLGGELDLVPPPPHDGPHETHC